MCLALAAAQDPAPAPESTTLAPDADKVNPQAVLETLLEDLKDQLRRPTLQWANALVMLSLGLVMVFDGRFVFKMIVVFAAGLFAFEMTLSEINEMQTSLTKSMTIVAGVEVACVAALVSYKGFEGVKYLLGIVAGGWAAWEIRHFALLHNFDYVNNGVCILILANVCIAIGMWMFGAKGHHTLVAVVCSLLGGSFVSSALGYFLMRLFVWQRVLINKNSQLNIAESTDAWFDFWMLIATFHGKVTGIFANSPYNHSPNGTEVSLDRVLGSVVWAIFALMGMWWQKRKAKQQLAPVSKPPKKSAVKAEHASEPLLSNAA